MSRKVFIAVVIAIVSSIFPMASFAAETSDTVYSYPEYFNCVLEAYPSCTAEKVELDSFSVLKVTPNIFSPSLTPALDSWSLDKGGKRADLAVYKYVSVSYFLSEDAAFDGNMTLRLLPGRTKAVKNSIYMTSTHKLVKGKWDKAYFKIPKDALNPSATDTIINQVHLYPYGNDVKNSALAEEDVIYIRDISFHAVNPDENAKVTITFDKTYPNAYGKLLKAQFDAFSKAELPGCPYTLSDATFVCWSDSMGKFYNAGDTIRVADDDLRLFAMWDIRDTSPPHIFSDFDSRFNSIVDGHDTATVSRGKIVDGIECIEVKVNPNAQRSNVLKLDGWNYTPLAVDIRKYAYVSILYKYVAENPVETKARLGIMKNGDIMQKALYADSLSEVKHGEWDIITFDISDAARLATEGKDKFIHQIHFSPLGNASVRDMDSCDRIYIASIAFSKNKPSFSVEQRVLKGFDDGTFKPHNTVSRAQAVEIVYRLSDSVLSDKTAFKGDFSDVSGNAWFYDSVSAFATAGYLDGVSEENLFMPNEPVTRAQFCRLLLNSRVADRSKLSSDTAVTFSDVSRMNENYSAIMTCAALGIVGGYPDGTFRPDSFMTRAECAIMIARATGRIGHNGERPFSVVFSDVDRYFYAFDEIAKVSVPYIVEDDRIASYLCDPVSRIAISAVPDFSSGDMAVKQVQKLADDRISEILSTPNSVDPTKVLGKVYYVSQNGNDNADGLTSQTAWKTPDRVNNQKLSFGDCVLFERGSTFRGGIYAKSGVTYSSYGSGEKPVLLGSPRDFADAKLWRLHHEGDDGRLIWVCDTSALPDIGSVTMNGGELYAKREVPSYIDGTFVVRGKNTPFDVNKHLDDLCYFHKADSVITGLYPNVAEARGELYLRCDSGNPGDVFESIELGTKIRAFDISKTSDVIIDNICFKYFSAAGVGGTGAVYNLKVTNCVAMWIGGSIQTYNFNNSGNGKVTRAGNGIETYGTTDGFTVDNCYVYQVYDAGLSHQVSSGGSHDVDMSNISYTNNVIENCVYGIEYFNGAPDNNETQRYGRNILIDGNIIRKSGYGFGSTRPDGKCQAAIKSWDSRNEFEDFRITNNVFDRSIWYLLHISAHYDEWMPEMQGNTYIQTYGKSLCSFKGLSVQALFDIGFRAQEVFGDNNSRAFYTSHGLASEAKEKTQLSKFGIDDMYE